MKKAFLSGLGIMGRRHLLGLLHAGFQVSAVDPRQASVDAAAQVAAKAGVGPGAFSSSQTIVPGEYDVAVFSETAPYRFENLSRFLERARAQRILLEKPLTANPAELGAYAALLSARGVPAESVRINLSRRTWPLMKTLKLLCDKSNELMLTVNGGAAGFGSNGIHLLDLYLFLSDDRPKRVTLSRLSALPIASGRGSEFSDVGGSFLIDDGRSAIFCSLSAGSSAPPMFVMRGEHFIAWLDEGDLRYRLQQRAPESLKPNYLCGHDYKVIEEGTMSLLSMDKLTEEWANGSLAFPTFSDGLKAHELLFDLLVAADCPRPYRFT